MMKTTSYQHKKTICVIFLICCISIFSLLKTFSNGLINQRSLITEYTKLDGDMNSEIDANVTECQSKAIDEFPRDFFTEKQRKQGGIIIHFVITLYLFGALAIICDDYFVKSLELLSTDLNMKADVAGATFMAAGSSAPELFTSLIGVTVAKSDVGLGTIVGSAVFNVLFIIALCAMVARKPLQLDYYPLMRDCIYYTISVGALIAVLYDEKIYWYEATILLVLYCGYIVIMYFNNSIEKSVKSKIKLEQAQAARINTDTTSVQNTNSESNFNHSHSSIAMSVINEPENTNNTETQNLHINTDDDDDDKPLNPFEIPSTKLKKVIWIVFLPISVLFYFTVPDCRRKIFSKFPFYFITFLMSTIYLGIFTYVLVWMIVIISYTINIPDTIAGLTLVAAGTSLPEIVTGIIVTRKGKADMAISNSIGSNIFDILVCLALPWFISTVIIHPNSTVRIFSGGITYSTGILLGTIVALIVLIILSKFILTKKLGVVLFILWAIVTVFTCLFELNVFGDFSLPLCP